MGFLSGLGKMLMGSKPGKPEFKQLQRFTPAQQASLSQLLSQGMADTDPAALESKYKHQYERETVPGLAEKFTAMGGGQRSSGFEESLRRGGLDLAEQLAGLRMQSGMQKLGLGLQPQFDTMMIPGAPGSQGLLGGLMGGMTGMLGAGLGGKLGGMLGMGGRGGMGGFGGMGRIPQYRSPLGMGMASRGQFMPGQPRGGRRGMNPVLLKILEGIQL